MYRPSFRTNRNNVPILTREEIDFHAENFLNDYNPYLLKTPMEIDIDDFAFNYLKLKQDFQYLSHNGIYLGMMVFNDTKSVIVYVPEKNQADFLDVKANTIIIDNYLLENNKEHPYRFTVGHECGHYIYDYKYYAYNPDQISLFKDEKPLIRCRVLAEYKKKHRTEWNSTDSMEWQANYFSSGILMPKSKVIEISNSITKRNEFREKKLITIISDIFNVSEESAEYRLNDLGLIKKPVHNLFSDLIY